MSIKQKRIKEIKDSNIKNKKKHTEIVEQYYIDYPWEDTEE